MLGLRFHSLQERHLILLGPLGERHRVPTEIQLVLSLLVRVLEDLVDGRASFEEVGFLPFCDLGVLGGEEGGGGEGGGEACVRGKVSE